VKISDLLEIDEKVYKWYQVETGLINASPGIKLLIVMIMTYWLFSGFNSKNDTMIKLPEVVVQKATTKTLPMTIKIPSSLIANAEVLIRTRIDGQIKSVHFQEGQYVQENDLLFKIDDELLNTQLEQAKANVEKDQAQLAQSEKTLARNQALLAKKVVTKAAIDQYETEVKKAKASLDFNKALIESLELQIWYAKIHSPINGIAGFIKVEPGSFVRQAENTNLVSIVKIDPIEAVFEIPEKHLAKVLEKGIESLNIKIFDVNNKEIPNKNYPTAIDQGINAKSGVFALKVSIHNENMHLRPGMSVTGYIQLDTFKDATVIPVNALLSTQEGNYIFIYDEKSQKVKKQLVTVQETLGNDAIITKGLMPDQMVVTNGQINIKDDMVVKVSS
jgi:multidrug efflux system membrane fusion protein